MKPKRKTKKKAAPQPRWKLRLVRRIRKVAEEMRQLGNQMDYHGGFGELGDHGREMRRAAGTALGWAAGLESEARAAKYRRLNEGEVIQPGDQFLSESGVWKPTTCPGMKALSPYYTSHTQYRRPVAEKKGKP